MIIDARRSLLKIRTHWYPVMQQLQRSMIAVSRVAVNRDGGRRVQPQTHLSGIMGKEEGA